MLAQQKGALLLEQAIPEDSLKNYFPTQDLQAIRITSDLIKKLHQTPIPKHNNFPHMRDWLSTLDKNWNIPTLYLEKAKTLKNKLLATTAQQVLLHGDLHHENILSHNNGFVIIDPKGVIGDPTYEVAAFIRNPIPELLNTQNFLEIIKKRIDIFAVILELEAQRITDWCFVQAVLAFTWALEDSCDARYFEHLTQIFNKLDKIIA